MDFADIVIPRTQIPVWCNKQNVGSSIIMDPLPHDENLIGVACCFTFVARDDPTSLGERWSHAIFAAFMCGCSGLLLPIPIHLGKDLITIGLEHLCLRFFTRGSFWVFDGTDTEFIARVYNPPGLHIEVKNCGYRWIFKGDLEQLNSQMMYNGNPSVQNMYLTND